MSKTLTCMLWYAVNVLMMRVSNSEVIAIIDVFDRWCRRASFNWLSDVRLFGECLLLAKSLLIELALVQNKFE